MKKAVLVVTAWLMVAGAAFAGSDKVIKPSLTLNHIQVVKSGEAYGDELYFDISVLRPGEDKVFYRVPKSPMQWSSSLISRYKNILLWSDEIKPDRKIVLLIALMDADQNPFNPDDMIGIIRAEISNDKGDFLVHWTIPNRSSGPVTIAGQHGDLQKFSLAGEHGEYDVYLSFKKDASDK